jgi:phosphoribosylcarboxyaminoimidazole (NCAIR) mutase
MMVIFFPSGSKEKVVLIAVAGRSNGLGPVLSGHTCFPVINCPPVKPENVTQDIWSSLNVPSGEIRHLTTIATDLYSVCTWFDHFSGLVVKVPDC